MCELCVGKKFPLTGIFYKCYRESLLESFVAQLSFWFYRTTKLLNSIDYYFVLTEFQKKKIKSLGIREDKILLKPNALSFEYNIYKNKHGYIYVGRLDESKGILDLLNVWSQLDGKYNLIVVGTGKLENKLKLKFKRNNITFKGKCSREVTMQLISKSKYLIQPSLLYESFGLTIIEAMSCGVPVIGFDVGTRLEFIKDSVNGFLSNKKDLKQVIERSFSFSDYLSLSNAALISSKKYSNSVVIKKQIQLYNEILSK